MPLTVPNLLTGSRIAAVPILVLVYYLPSVWAGPLATALFVFAGITDWLDGYLARRLGQHSPFGAFLDPVADKLMVASALVLLLGDPELMARVISPVAFTVTAALIIGREIVVSALREWMAELGKRASVAVSLVGKGKTLTQFVAIAMLLYQQPVLGIAVARLGEILLYAAAVLTLWSMVMYLRAAWPALTGESGVGQDI